jgi:hypothetical protein
MIDDVAIGAAIATVLTIAAIVLARCGNDSRPRSRSLGPPPLSG